MTTAFTIHRPEPHEWERLREIRLRALADAPDAFGATLAEALARPEAFWREWAAGRASAPRAGDPIVSFVAVAAGEWRGLVSGIGHADQPESAELISMWVDPALRGRGAGAALVQTVVDWARARGTRRLDLWITSGNRAARALYERAGFVATGETQPHPAKPELSEEAMTLAL